MANHKRTTEAKSNKKSRPKARPPLMKQQVGTAPGTNQWLNSLAALEDEKIVQAQAAKLSDPRWQGQQKQGWALQMARRQGNKHFQQVMQLFNHQQTQKGAGWAQRHSIDEAPPPVEEEEIQAQRLIQRHTIAEAPPPVEEEEVQTKPVVQRTLLPSDLGGRGSDSSRAAVDHPAGKLDRPHRQAAFGKAGAETVSRRPMWMVAPSQHSLQRKGGKEVNPVKEGPVEAKGKTPAVKFGKITFTPKEIPADGKTTTKAAVTTVPGGRPLKWGLTGPDYGSSISAAGLITAGNDLKGQEKAGLQVKAMDAKSPVSFTVGTLTLWDAKLYQAKLDYPKFVAGGPYTYPNFTIGKNGKFDVEYAPAANLVNVNLKVKFTFPDDQQPDRSLWNLFGWLDSAERKAREARHKAYRQKFIKQVTASWSQRYQFKNVREPQSVWGKLTPTTVKVNVSEVDKNQHFEIQARQFTKGRASVGGGVTKLYKGDDTPQPRFNTGAAPGATGRGELTRVERILPKIGFANNSARIDPKYQPEINFLATYLKRINNPQFKLDIVGHASKTGKPANNQTLSENRAQAVETALTGAGLTNHILSNTGVGDTGADATAKWRKVVIRPSLAKTGWQNLQDTTAHEFGHMIGLGDEYGAGNATHYNLVKKAFGQKYADQVAKRGDTDYASIMEGGDDVRIQHYVTFWSALCETTAKAPVPATKFGYDDWKFIG